MSNPLPSSSSDSPDSDWRDLPPIDPNKPLPPEYWPDTSHLITETDEPVDNIFSEKQQRLLAEPLYSSWQVPGDGRGFAVFANVGLFFQINEHALVPDVLLSLDVKIPEDIWTKSHRSYLIWEYGKPPDVVLEIVSNREGGEFDRKFDGYARLGVIYYVIFDPQKYLSNSPLRIYKLLEGRYIESTERWLPKAEIGLTLWRGSYEGREDTWLRWCNKERQVILSGAERAEQEKQRAESEKQRADNEKQRADRLAAKLRELGIDPEQI